jgi:hypothetical protein
MYRETPAAMYALFGCELCEREWAGDLPPLWVEDELWPTCCGESAKLLVALVAAED